MRKKRKSEVKKSDVPVKTKETPGEANLPPGTKQKPGSRKSSTTAEPSHRNISETVPEGPRKTSESTSTPVPVCNSGPISNAVQETPKATVEDALQSERRASYIAPKAATKRDVDLLYELDEEKLLELREAFHLFDLNNDGFIDKEDLRNTYITLGKTDIEDKQIQRMLSEAINPLDFDAFVILLGFKTIELDPEEVLLKALSQWDYDESGFISEERIKHDLMMWGDRFTPEEVEVALEDAPVFIRQNNAMIDYVKFCKILCGLRRKSKLPQPGN